jgi:WD40 repeat protein
VRCLDGCGRLLAAGLSSGAIVIFDREKLAQGSSGAWEPEATFETHTSWVYSVCCRSHFTHANGAVSALVASGSRDTTVRVYAGAAPCGVREQGARKWQEIFIFEGHTDWVAHVTWSHCGTLLLSCCNHGVLNVWSLTQGTNLRRFNTHEHPGLWWMELHDVRPNAVVVSSLHFFQRMYELLNLPQARRASRKIY